MKNEHKSEEVVDILWAFEIYQDEDILNNKSNFYEKEEIFVIENEKNIFEWEEIKIENSSTQEFTQKNVTELKNNISTKAKQTKTKFDYFLSYSTFALKYSFTSVVIFAVLLLGTNYSAYINLAQSYFWDNSKQEWNFVASVNATKIESPEVHKKTKKERLEELSAKDSEVTNQEDKYSIKSMIAKSNSRINLNIDIVPYENRLIIPKLGKNIPLMDVKDSKASSENELNDIFMKELEGWVVRYPWSAQPWKIWNSFIFWHSSNFPWIPWKYNDVFSTLWNLKENDEVIAYYGQKQYTYVIKEKKVISPRDIDILKRDKWKAEITLMTCWPLGTTLNRLILVWELKK